MFFGLVIEVPRCTFMFFSALSCVSFASFVVFGWNAFNVIISVFYYTSVCIWWLLLRHR